ncbi:hypothetical protein HYDPIDRAFT_26605 [Hydnomerulius pinastri MD-312]|nr:hypothetical protein HYDPIDRAFT_26605 [Hydnomerulius pinastri MD-312]
MDFQFKIPSSIPQDLLLIQDLVGTPPPRSVTPKCHEDPSDSSDDSIASTDNEVDSEDEVEADLLPREPGTPPVPTALSGSPSGSDSDSDSDTSSSSESEDDDVQNMSAPQTQKTTYDLDDEESGATAAATYLQTKNEIVEANVMTPTISEVEPGDALEKIGEVMSIVGNVVIVKGLPADHVKILSERALDAESLLVFEDRKVLGYIYETFGPTSQPMYQIKFNQNYPLDIEKVRISREVFHVPQHSRFVFVNQLKKLRGSDASNIHDEEPAEDEIEFSDDEQEAAFKASRKKRRSQSVSSSRQTTPAPSRAHVDDMIDDTFYGSNPYDAHGPYDDNYRVAGPSRPAPIPYDDPYADTTGSDTIKQEPQESLPTGFPPSQTEYDSGARGRGRGRDRGRFHDRGGSRMPRDRGSDRGARGRGDRNRQQWSNTRQSYHSNSVTSQETFGSSVRRSVSPTSRAIERATGQFADGNSAYSPAQQASDSWAYQQPNNLPTQNYQQPFVQPHINPRFASAFGFNFQGTPGQWHSQQQMPGTPYYMSQPQQNWADQWTVHDSTGADGDGDTYTPR